MTNADFVNVLLERVHPWYPLRFIFINDIRMLLYVGSTKAGAIYSHDEERWLLEEIATSDAKFIEQVNAFICGATRDDDGVLHFD